MKCNSAFALLVCFVAVLAHPASAATSSVGAPPGAMPGTPPITGLVTDEFAITAGEAGLPIASQSRLGFLNLA